MPFDFHALIQSLPFMLGANNPAVMEGYRLAQEDKLKTQQLRGQDQLREAQIGNLEADNRRAEEAASIDRLSKFYQVAPKMAEQTAATATDPVQANLGLAKQLTGVAQTFGVDPALGNSFVPNMTEVVSNRKKKNAQALVDKFDKEYGAQAADAQHSVTLQSGEFAGKTIAQVRQLTENAIPPAPAATKPATSPGPGTFGEFVDAPPARQAQILKSKAQYDAAGKPPQTGAAGLTPNAALDATMKLRDRFTKETQAAQAVNTQLQLMKSSLAAVKSGAAAPGSQGVLVTFQKILDPTSVVRESEYARSASGLSLLSRMEGAYGKIVNGGAGVPIAELEKFVTLAEQFVRNQASAADTTKRQIDSIASEYGLKPENITRDLGLPTATPESADPALQILQQRRKARGVQ